MEDHVVLFDGTSTDGWRMAGPGGFDLVDGTLESHGGMGLLWYTGRPFADFVLDVHWAVARATDNSGVFLRFPDPGDDPWVAVHHGYEVQIHDTAPETVHQTGGIYSFAAPSRAASNPAGAWNHFRIVCVGQDYAVALNGLAVTTFTGSRSTEGFVGIQNHDPSSRVRFRRIAVTVVQ
ncbi:MAG TPA: DUF1080 domain-containing protein [Acidimicrobiia bacterium]|nr:DUF1080 domain-containing protein [Acidimicrobiia bacterium]